MTLIHSNAQRCHSKAIYAFQNTSLFEKKHFDQTSTNQMLFVVNCIIQMCTSVSIFEMAKNSNNDLFRYRKLFLSQKDRVNSFETGI